MFQWSDEHQMIREAVKRFVDDEIRPHVDDLEHGDLPPYDILRKLFATFGMDAMARDSFKKGIERERAIEAGEDVPEKESGGDGGGMSLIPIIELCRVCPGMVTAMGVSMGLTSAAIMSNGTIAQKERWALDLLTMDKIGAWAITEPGSGSDAFGSMRSTARRDGDEYVLNGSKTFITNGPYADTTVFICKLDDGETPPEQRKVLSFVQKLVFRTMEMGAAGVAMTLAEASARKLYSARAATEVALEAVQLFGGNGYMSEFRVEQLARDAKVLQIYAGTDEIQIVAIAKDLLRT